MYGVQLMRKNQYEEALFRAEDDRFELDMVIECGASAIQRLQPLAEQLQGLEADERANFRIPDGVMGPIHYRAVQKIYGGVTLSASFVHSVFSCFVKQAQLGHCSSAQRLQGILDGICEFILTDKVPSRWIGLRRAVDEASGAVPSIAPQDMLCDIVES